MNRRRIRIAFSDFWPGFDPRSNYFTELLAPEFNLELSDSPDFLIHSWFGHEYLRHRCVRIYYAGECSHPDFRVCDFALTFDHLDDPRHYRLPLYALYFDPALLVKRAFDPARTLAAKTAFCNFVYSNPRCQRRNRFLEKLGRYKRVDSGGRWRNNIGGPVTDKLGFIAKYKFTIAFENVESPGYTTEKIVEPMRMGSLPIYWGNPAIARDFNPRSFLSWYDYGSDEALIERVIALDRDDDAYCRMLAEPWFHHDTVPAALDPANVRAFFRRVFESGVTPVAQQRRRVGWYDAARVRIQEETTRRGWNWVNRLYFALDRLRHRPG